MRGAVVQADMLLAPRVPVGESHVVPVCFDSFCECGDEGMLVRAEPNLTPEAGQSARMLQLAG